MEWGRLRVIRLKVRYTNTNCRQDHAIGTIGNIIPRVTIEKDSSHAMRLRGPRIAIGRWINSEHNPIKDHVRKEHRARS